HGDDDVAARQLDAIVESARLAPVFLPDYPYARVGLVLPGRCERPILRPIIQHDDLVVLVVAPEQRLDRIAHDLLFVIGRDEHRDERLNCRTIEPGRTATEVVSDRQRRQAYRPRHTDTNADVHQENQRTFAGL